MQIPQLVLAFSLAFCLALPLSACERGPAASGSAPAADQPGDEPAELARVDFAVSGMDCAGCVIGARTALRRLDGVHEAHVAFESIESSPAWAVYDPERVTPERMIEAIGTLGYTATVVEEPR